MSTRKEEWRNLPGYGGWYQVSDWGRIRSFYCGGHHGFKRKEPKLLAPWERTVNGFTTVFVSVRKEGRSNNTPLGRLVAITWLGAITDGMRVYHRDGNPRNNSRWNLEYRPPFLEYNKNNPSKRRPVVKMDLSLEILDCYGSARKAAQANGLGHRTVLDYCNQTTRTIIAPDGFIYAWDDDTQLEKTLRRAMKELDALGIPYNDPYTSRYYDLPTEAEPEAPTELDWIDLTPAITLTAGEGRFGAFRGVSEPSGA